MTIILNGDPCQISQPMTVAELLAQLEIDPRRVAVEHNLIVLKRGTYDRATLHEGDQVEVVNLVGGGAGGLKRPSARAARSTTPQTSAGGTEPHMADDLVGKESAALNFGALIDRRAPAVGRRNAPAEIRFHTNSNEARA